MRTRYDTYVGFDSAWTDNSRAPGAICALDVAPTGECRFHEPRLASFSDALDFIREVAAPAGCTLIALDQPTIVPNASGRRPVEGAASTLIGWLGGGVQPSNRGKVGMFCDASPIWPFLRALGATEAPMEARTANAGLYLIEVFPALALPSIDARFFGRLAGPKYNPERRTFRLQHWHAVAEAAAANFVELGFPEPAGWCRGAAVLEQPRKADQDRLDSLLCLLIALSWRLKPRTASMVLGSLETGYMVLPAAPAVRERLTAAASQRSVPLDAC